MSQAMRGELSVADSQSRLRRELLEIAAGIEANGGPTNSLQRGWVDSAEAAGIAPIEINALASSKRPVLRGLEPYIRIDNF